MHEENLKNKSNFSNINKKLLENRIFIVDEVLDIDTCSKVINVYKENGPTHQWNMTNPMTIDDTNSFLVEVISKISNTVNEHLNVLVDIEWCQIVEWPPGSYHTPHLDEASEDTVFTSITYLNDNYAGGETFIFDDILITPKLGRTVFFDGKFYVHGVSPVKNNCRYTLPIWYKF